MRDESIGAEGVGMGDVFVFPLPLLLRLADARFHLSQEVGKTETNSPKRMILSGLGLCLTLLPN